MKLKVYETFTSEKELTVNQLIRILNNIQDEYGKGIPQYADADSVVGNFITPIEFDRGPIPNLDADARNTSVDLVV